jgi:hypothetical protein
MNSQQSIGLLIVDDQPIVIEGLTSAFHAMTPHIDALSAGSIEDAISNFRNASHLSLILSDFGRRLFIQRKSRAYSARI